MDALPGFKQLYTELVHHFALARVDGTAHYAVVGDPGFTPSSRGCGLA